MPVVARGGGIGLIAASQKDCEVGKRGARTGEPTVVGAGALVGNLLGQAQGGAALAGIQAEASAAWLAPGEAWFDHEQGLEARHGAEAVQGDDEAIEVD